MENKTQTKELFEIDETNNGKLLIASDVVQKLIYHLLISENYQVNLNDIKIFVQENDNLEVAITIVVESTSNLIDLKNQVISLILKRIKAMLNVNISNINLMFSFN